ncbi:hypothetical protein SDRG_15801 [Saprolegnia diclina VS20]|uniref:Uncharacterized protein n=1 Tax=Saprolegnia diclina (strain VS20) TaxID=1156394 RepID=T0R9W6_SAPDV|nr:hypothetical protein SDRG_15801 [Saprolegnia diclina VS20]EQC26312.1 hypothetical protein SDRG_15801 [Saprolegnia diclina VS20]|eukprot:XP_008620205.1 hypothetical protein SDRG_15801 [Saprolegnia diclina VS20]
MSTRRTAYHLLARGGYASVVRLLLDAGASLDDQHQARSPAEN